MNELDFLFFSKRHMNIYIPNHLHECYELVYYFQGHGETQIGSEVYEFRKNMFTLIPPRVVHDERHTFEGEVLFIGFHSDHAAIKNLNVMYKDDDKRTIQQLMIRIKNEFGEQQYGYSDMLNLLLGELIIQIQRLMGKKKNINHSDDLLQYVLNYMDEHYQQKISIDSLAQLSGYSYDRFRHLFKEKYNIAPIQYLFYKRINHAKSLLLETKMLISVIALNTGFANDAQFCSIFRRETGMTPNAFRKDIL